jgi:hypothetical protein
VRTHLHDFPVCEACRGGNHEDCIEASVSIDFVCGCTDESHFEDSLGEDAEW